MQEFLKRRHMLSAPERDMKLRFDLEDNEVVWGTTFLFGESYQKKKTRGARLFYLTPRRAVEDAEEAQRKRRKRRRLGEDTADADLFKGYLYIPLEPGRRLWAALKVPDGMSEMDAIEEALWLPISPEFVDALAFFTRFLNDGTIPLEETVDSHTLDFFNDYQNAIKEDEFKRKLDLGVLAKYTGPLELRALDTDSQPYNFPVYV